MSEPNPTEFLDKYQYIAFKWVLFVVFLVMTFQFLDHHIHFTAAAKRFMIWIRELVKSGLL